MTTIQSRNRSWKKMEKEKKKEKEKERRQHHFLLVGLHFQGHLTPMLNLANRLTSAGVHVTLSTAVSCHRLMFPGNPDFPFVDESDPLLCYFPYSDGFDGGFDRSRDKEDYWVTAKTVGRRSLRSIASTPATDGKPAVTCIVYSMFLQWAVSVANDVGVPAVNFWIQPTAVFAIYYHYLHGYKDFIDARNNDPNLSVEFPGMFPIEIRDLPSFLVERSDSDVYSLMAVIARGIKDMFVVLDREIEKNPIVLVNSFESLEEDVNREMKKKLRIVPIGPMITGKGTTSKRVVTDKKNVDTGEYMVWLEQWPEKSVIYLSFGSLSLLSQKQNQEFSSALVECGRPFLWVVRGDREGVEVEEATINGGKGMVVGWCSQVEVLSHSSIGCFVTHCGWNSTLESLVAGVPTVAFPQWSDQATNSRLMEDLWKTGVRMKVDEDDGVVKREELKRCLDLLMGEEEDIGVEIRRNAQIWKEKAREAVANGGSSYCNLMDFIETVGFSK